MTPRPGFHLPAHELEYDPLEALVEEAVDEEVHDAVEDEEEVVDGSHAHEPDGRPEVVPAADHQVHLKQLVEVEQQPREVGHEEHAHHADEEHGQLQVLGLQQGNRIQYNDCIPSEETKSSN